MIPTQASNCPHFNFPEILSHQESEPILLRLQKALNSNLPITDIVLNFEKSHWFEIFPLAQLLIMLTSQKGIKPRVHVVGPSIKILPYFQKYIDQQNELLQSSDLSHEERLRLEWRVRRHSQILPQLRARAGSFLVGWGVFDLIEEHYGDCAWYSARGGDEISLYELRKSYLFGYGAGWYGAGAPVKSHDSDRVWPFTLAYRSELDQMVERINGEELIAGALRRHARTDLIADGSAQNVLFFEPFENVFVHAYNEPSHEDGSLVVMRVTDWMFDAERQLSKKAEWLLSKLPVWERTYIESLRNKGGSFMEIVISDGGQGIASSIANAMLQDVNYCTARGIMQGQNIQEISDGAWEAIRYAFESHSTRRLTPPPGKRGLAWIREKMKEAGGMIHVYSNGANYVLADYGGGQVELPPEQTTSSAVLGSDQEEIAGTTVRIVFPLEGEIKSTPDRRPKWDRTHPDPTLFTDRQEVRLRRFPILSPLVDASPVELWDHFFEGILAELEDNPSDLIVLDFVHKSVTRWSLETMFESFLQHPGLHGRLIIVNCSRQVACRLDTVTSVEGLKQAGLVLPIFETSLRMYWAGATRDEERALLHWFQHGPSESPEVINVAPQNPGYFLFDQGYPFELTFSIEDVEGLVRTSLGNLLEKSLSERGAIHRGAFRMPLTGQTVSTFVEPHQIFADGKVASLLCSHLAVLLRWRYGKMESAGSTNRQRVLTATRIGRDIATRMPEAYQPKKIFIYFDYHLMPPDQPQVVKDLADISVVIVVDIVTTGSQVEQLIKICEDAGGGILGVVSFIDFSSGSLHTPREFISRRGSIIEHKTFWRSPQNVRDAQEGDREVDAVTLSISPPVEAGRDYSRISLLTEEVGLRLLEDAEAIHYGHYEVFDHHFEFVVNFGRLLTTPSLQRDIILRTCEETILRSFRQGIPTALVLYPDNSNAHILHGLLERRHRIKSLVDAGRLRFIEVRRHPTKKRTRYWLTKDEIGSLERWARETFGENYAVLLLDDEAITGDTMLSLLDLGRELNPKETGAFVVINQMPELSLYDNREFERHFWASSPFNCLLHLNIPVYTSQNCPMCREKSRLTGEMNEAKTEWLKVEISRRIEQLEATTTLHPQDIPKLLPVELDSRESMKSIKRVNPFPWEDGRIIPGESQSIISRALNARVALSSGYPVLNLLKEISQQSHHELFRLTILEIARRVEDIGDLDESENIRDAMLMILRGRHLRRRMAVVEALRLMPVRLILPVIDRIVNSTLTRSLNDDLTAELIILIRRIFSDGSLSLQQVFDKDIQVADELDQAIARSSPGTNFRLQLERIKSERVNIEHVGYEGRSETRYDLPTLLKRLEGILMTHRRPEHQLMHELQEYISDQRTDADQGVRGALDNAVMAVSLGKVIVPMLVEAGRLHDDQLPRKIDQAYYEASELRWWVESHMQGNEARRASELRLKLTGLKELCGSLEAELRSHLVQPVKIIEDVYENLRVNSPWADLPDVKETIRLAVQIPKSTVIIIDRGLFQRIVKNLFFNLKHALDMKDKKISAVFTLYGKNEAAGSQACLNITCQTRGNVINPVLNQESTTTQLYKEAKPYGVSRSVAEGSRSEGPGPWNETWSFWRL